jgi:hypothetical protein
MCVWNNRIKNFVNQNDFFISSRETLMGERGTQVIHGSYQCFNLNLGVQVCSTLYAACQQIPLNSFQRVVFIASE